MFLTRILKKIIFSFSKAHKLLILKTTDVIFLFFSILYTNYLLKDTVNSNSFLESNLYYFLIILIALILYSLTNQYKGLIRYKNSKSFYKLATRNIFLILILQFVSFFFFKKLLSLKYISTFWITITGSLIFIRLLMRDILLKINEVGISKKKKVAIYGAGSAGAQLAASLRLANSHEILFFIDDNKELENRNLGGISIIHSSNLEKSKSNLEQVLLAIPSLKKTERIKILQSLEDLGISVLMVPSIDDLSSGKLKINSLQPIAIEDLLTRQIVLPDKDLLGNSITNQIICVTGSGGSIGSELCRQILNNKPAKLVIFERNELSLYKINHDLSEINKNKIIIESVLGSVTDFPLVLETFEKHKVDIVFHAAAYKHVPLVELNPISGIKNNVFSTSVVAKAALKANVKKMILISTDKAVRPTNIMGATKRLSELIFQAYAQDSQTKNINTCFSMVRFGNVLGSSGSVVPAFKRQISLGGPITLTDPRIIRYIMTITEASQLVIQSASLAKGGEVFILDMGAPILIEDLAKKMIRLSGLSVKDKNNPEGDIEIKVTGLRPGEKLFEELLIGKDSEGTAHPLIFKAKERSISLEVLWNYLNKLEVYIEKRDLKEVKKILKKLVPEWVELTN